MAHSSSPLYRYHRACRSGLQVDIRLGSPMADDCSGLGICSFRLRGQADAAVGYFPALTGYLRIDPATHRLLLHLDSMTLDPCLRQRHFVDGHLTVNTAYPLPPAIVRRLGLAAGIHLIVQGQYPVLDDGTFLTTSFRLAQEQALRRPAA